MGKLVNILTTVSFIRKELSRWNNYQFGGFISSVFLNNGKYFSEVGGEQCFVLFCFFKGKGGGGIHGGTSAAQS